MRVMTAVLGFIATAGLGLTLYSGYRIVSGPFLGGPLPDGLSLMLSLGGFIVGIVVFAWGLTRVAGVGARM